MQVPSKLLMLLMLSLPMVAKAADNWLIATQSETLNTGQKIEMDAIKPDNATHWPEKLLLKLSSGDNAEVIELTQTQAKLESDTRRTYSGVPKTKFLGVIRAELEGLTSNRLLMLASGDDYIAPMRIIATTPSETDSENTSSRPEGVSTTKVVLAQPGEEPPVSANEPLYFIVGSNNERNFDARFQISFKYRPFDPEARVAQFIPFASNLYFAYTQTSIWDLGGHSSPFKDTSYRPSIYYKWTDSGRDITPDVWKAGFEHESNGRDNEDSRSINMAFIQPLWNIDFAHGRRLSFMPKIYQYLEKSDNSDIQRYRGYVDWQARFGREDGAILTGLYRQGTGGYASGQLDLSYPISDKIFGRTGTFIHLQLLSGYGETLIDYNRQGDTQLRIGLSLAR